MLPSGSLEANVWNVHVKLSHDVVKNDAAGGWFATPAYRNTARPRQSIALFTTVPGSSTGTPPENP